MAFVKITKNIVNSIRLKFTFRPNNKNTWEKFTAYCNNEKIKNKKISVNQKLNELYEQFTENL